MRYLRPLSLATFSLAFLTICKPVFAYDVAITINATLSSIPGATDPLNLGAANPPYTVTITGTLPSSAMTGSSATYNAQVSVSLPQLGITNETQSGTFTINTDGTLQASFMSGKNSFNATVQLSGVSFPGPNIYAFGSKSFSAPSSTATYNLLGAIGTVGLNGTIDATGLTVSPSSVSASFNGSSAPQPQTINVSTNGGAALSYTASLSGSSTSFVTLGFASGTTPGTIPLTFSTSVAAGTYMANLLVNTSDNSGTPLSIPITYTVTGTTSSGPMLMSMPSSIGLTYTQGGSAPGPQTLNLSASSGTINFTASPSVPWITVTPTSGSTPATLSVTVNPAGLPAGSSSGIINISGSGSFLSIPVTVNVVQPGGGLQILPTSATIQFYAPTTQGTQVIDVEGPANEGFTASTTDAFLKVSPAAGTAPAFVIIMASSNGLMPGSYSGSVTLTSSSGAVTNIPVTFEYGVSSATAPITLTPNSLSFSYPFGSAPTAQTIMLASSSATSFTVTAPAGLTVTPTSGTTPTSIQVAVSPTAFPAGTHQLSISVQAGGGTTSIPVTLNVSAAASGYISVAPLSLTFSNPATSSSPLSQTFMVNATAAVPFTVSSSVPWLTLTPSSGTSPATVTATANAAGLTAQTYTGTITITSANAVNSPVAIPVTFNVTQGAPAVLTFMPTSLAFVAAPNGSAPASQTVAISGVPAGGAGITLAAFGANWLSATLSADSSTATVSVNPAGLATGAYSGSIKISGPGVGPYFIPVALAVSSGAAVAASPTSLTFNILPGASSSAQQTIAVASTTAATETATTDSAWLSVTPASLSTPGTFTISVTPTGLANGTYRGNITLTSSGSTALITTIPVTLNISATAIPVINAVTSAITYMSSVGAPGLLIAIWGNNLGPDQAASGALTPDGTAFATSDSGTQVFADGIACPILFVSNQQVNAVLPFSLQGQASADIELQYQGITSNTITLPIQASAPGIFSANGTGQGTAAIQNSDLSYNSSSNGAAGGSEIAIYAGGAGATDPAGQDGALTLGTMLPTPVLPVSVTIGGQPATVVFKGDAPLLVAGVLQVNVIVPTGLTPGPQPVVLTVGTVSSPANLVVYTK